MFRSKIAFTIIALLTPLALVAQEKAPERRAPDQYGRYVVTFSPFARADTFLIDTLTGKAWQLTRYGDLQGEPIVFKNLERIDSEIQFDLWLKTQRLKDGASRQ